MKSDASEIEGERCRHRHGRKERERVGEREEKENEREWKEKMGERKRDATNNAIINFSRMGERGR